MQNWMKTLAAHYEQLRRENPDDELLALFEVDGAILDTRHMTRFLLFAFDRANSTEHFADLDIGEVPAGEEELQVLFEKLGLSGAIRKRVRTWYYDHRWSTEVLLEAHRPFRGVMEMIRWFQLQPKTRVGLNSARPEYLRSETLLSLNRLGEEYKVRFDNSLLRMNRPDEQVAEVEAKAAGIRYFKEKGLNVFAVIDSDPVVLKSLAETFGGNKILWLPARTLLNDKRNDKRQETQSAYDFTHLFQNQNLPRHIQLVWHALSRESDIRAFISSNVHWGETRLRLNPSSGFLQLRPARSEFPIPLEQSSVLPSTEVFARCLDAGKGLKLDFKGGRILMEKALAELERFGFEDESLWFNGNVERLQESGFRRLSQKYPGAIIQCPVDFLAPLTLEAPDKAKEILDMLKGWGINRFSLSWDTPDKRRVLDRMDSWNLDLHIYQVPDLEQFMQAVLLLPRSITATFRPPQWDAFGQNWAKLLTAETGS